MAHPAISTVRLLPRGIPTACRSCLYPSGRGGGRYANAESWLVCPDGLAISQECAEHAAKIVAEFRDKINERWSVAPIYHENGGRFMQDRTSTDGGAS